MGCLVLRESNNNSRVYLMEWGFYHFSVKRSVDFTLTRIAGSASSPAQDEAGRG